MMFGRGYNARACFPGCLAWWTRLREGDGYSVAADTTTLRDAVRDSLCERLSCSKHEQELARGTAKGPPPCRSVTNARWGALGPPLGVGTERAAAPEPLEDDPDAGLDQLKRRPKLPVAGRSVVPPLLGVAHTGLLSARRPKADRCPRRTIRRTRGWSSERNCKEPYRSPWSVLTRHGGARGLRAGGHPPDLHRVEVYANVSYPVLTVARWGQHPGRHRRDGNRSRWVGFREFWDSSIARVRGYLPELPKSPGPSGQPPPRRAVRRALTASRPRIPYVRRIGATYRFRGRCVL